MKKIFIIEDDPDIGDVVEIALSDSYLVKVHTTYLHLLTVLEEFMPDLIMIDNSIGQKESPEIVREIRSVDAFKYTPLILFSGNQNIQRIAVKINASAYLAKPFNLTDLYSCIEDVLSTIPS